MGKEEKSGSVDVQFEEDDVRILRGEMEIVVREARDLPDTDNMFFSKLINSKDVTDSFVTAHLGNCRILMTSVKDNSLNPVWNERFVVPVCHLASGVVFKIRDKDHIFSEDIGEVRIGWRELEEGEVEGWRPITDRSGRNQGELCVSVVYRDAMVIPKEYAIDSYNSMKGGNDVRLYSCARNARFPVQISNGESYQPGSCYLDMFKAIVGAEKFIYITGWSVWTALQLVRGEDIDDLTTDQEVEHAGLNLGELLLARAKTGVRVLIMIWSEISSGAFNEKGMMGTHDQETFNFFRGTSVECFLVPREIGMNDLTDMASHQLASASYTHHQKTIIVDAEPTQDDERRTLMSFVGGLDLTDGRYDTPEHPLFWSMTGMHSGDFYQNSAPGVTEEWGPRQPWQDIHCRVVGPAAWDVWANFCDRWNKQARGAGPLYPLRAGELNDAISDGTGNWNVQFLRSITNDSAVFSNQMREYTLTVKKSRKIDESIAKAYISAIRAAEKFIYIENQYFLGSAYAWGSDQEINCHHTVPAEIAEKICEKIFAGDEFRAYIVIPLHPEGDPATMALQEILAWQRRTMEMMYRRIAQALEAVGSDSNPSNYLVFMCLVNRETSEHVPEELEDPLPGSRAELLRETKRFMIYVHSKLCIVDDSLAIIGSANINQRSLAGSRDTECAVSVHQDGYTYQSLGELPAGEVASFRIRLFEEHLGVQGDALTQPYSGDCLKFVQQVCQQNWQDYVVEGSDDGMMGHAVLYPIDIDQQGNISELDGFACFPDTSAPIAGAVSNMLPMKLTT